MGYVAGIGGANMDIHGRSEAPMRLRDSNPGRIAIAPGGVCRNIMENLARLGEDARLVTALGDDGFGRALLRACREAGVGMEGARVMPGERTSCYVSVVDGDGDMLLAMSDMRILKRLDGAFVDGAAALLGGAELVVCDGNLSPAAVRRLTQIVRAPLYLDPVSVAWARELRPQIGAFDTVKPNRFELSALTGLPAGTEEELLCACRALHREGVARVFVSLGEDGMLMSAPEGTLRARSRPLPGVVNAGGAGDAAMAGIVWASRRGLSPERTLHTAMAAGMLTCLSPETVSPALTPEAVENMIKEYVE